MEDQNHLNPVWVYEINWILIYSLIKVLSASGGPGIGLGACVVLTVMGSTGSEGQSHEQEK